MERAYLESSNQNYEEGQMETDTVNLWYPWVSFSSLALFPSLSLT